MGERMRQSDARSTDLAGRGDELVGVGSVVRRADFCEQPQLLPLKSG